MSDEVLNIMLTAREIDLIHQCISTNIETVKQRHDPTDPMIADLLTELGELSDDLLEQRFNPEDPNLFMDPVDFAAKHDPSVNHTFTATEQSFIQAGITAREQMKASSRAASRRALKFSGHRDDGDLSETQKHDLWSKPSNDPADW